MDIYKKVCNNIKYYRIKNNITQEQMSECLYLSPKHYSHLENGDYKFSLDKIQIICNKLNITLTQVFEEDH